VIKPVLNNYSYIVTRSPLRISLVGGGTDFSKFYSENGGYFISSAINKFIYCTIKRHGTAFDEAYRLNYSDVEMVNRYSEIKNEIIRASLDRFSAEGYFLDRLYIGTIGDMPSNSGLGSSSAFSCALDLGLNQLSSNLPFSPNVLATRACALEIDILKKPIGIQDQWATANGGLRWYQILNDGEVVSGDLNLTNEQKVVLSNSLLLVDTGKFRNAESITKTYSHPDRNQEKLLLKLLHLAQRLGVDLSHVGVDEIPNFLGEQLRYSWDLKKNLSSQVSSSSIDDLYETLLSLGCLGGKISGAGGGGYLLMVAPPERMDFIKSHLTSLKILFETPSVHERGTEVLVNC